ncbi:MAG: hypothetical protein MI863_09440 [Desulfobacterales bacterium]|nr:hypothetical protein [Desulfobacterales bacterium]
MGIAYSVFCIALTLAFTLTCFRRRYPKWWPVVVLAFPLAAPAFVFKSKKGNLGTWVALTLAGVAIAAGIEIWLYKEYKEKNKYSHLPPVVREMIRLNEDVKNSTIALYQASGKLDSLGLAMSRIGDLTTTLGLIGEMREMILENQAAIDRLVGYIEDHGDFIQRQNLGWAFWISKFYKDRNVTLHHESRLRYFNAYEDMLQYTYDNFDNIMELQSSAHMANYDAYYMRYRGVADMHNRFNKKRIAFQKSFVKEHPEVMPFLPGAHHLEPFKFWDKFSF